MPLLLRIAFWMDVHILHPLEYVLPLAYEYWLMEHVCIPLERRANPTGDW